MLNLTLTITASLLLSAFAFAQAAGQTAPPPANPADPAETSAAKGPLSFKVRNIDGEQVDLAAYNGQVVLIVNVASKCGLTPQYAQLQELHEKFAPKGLRILAFPSNDFMGQEPGTNEEIKEFCKTTYGIGFDLFEKISVKGDEACELYRHLTSKTENGEFGGEIRWNFTKFLVGRDGRVIARFEPRTRPDAPEVIAAIEKALKASKS